MTFNEDCMLAFLEQFNPIFQRFFAENVVPEKYADKLIYSVEEYVSQRQELFSGKKKLSADEMVDAYKIVDKVYGNSDSEQDYIYIYQMIRDKFIDEFVNIDGMEDLYRPMFFVFEWMMHLEYKPEKDSYSFYRDHFIHQARNMYEMLQLLTDKEIEMYKVCIDSFERGSSLLDIEMRTIVNEVLKTEQGIEDFKKIGNIIKDEYNYKEAVYKYILMASAVVTSVVHDIGYPIEYFCNNLERMEIFLPVSGYFFEKKSYESQLYVLLEESLLYRIIEPEKIAKRLNTGDHGAISACILLIKYYKNGKIHALSPIQRMIIELSALTIYEHTLRYEIHKEKDEEKIKADKVQPVVEENPFSALFRLCDDIEEWNRTYFDITKQSNFFVCNKCHTVINPWKAINSSDSKSKVYACCCEKKGENHNLFKYRKMAHINTCQKVEFDRIENIGGTFPADNKLGYRIRIDYDLMALLQAAAYGEQFAVKRAEGLTEIKKMIFDQKGMYSIYVDSFISNNPIAIKTEIVSRYMQQIEKEKWEELLDACKDLNNITKILSKVWGKGYNKFCKKIVGEYYGDGNNKVKKLLTENLIFYLKLAVLQAFLNKYSEKIDEDMLLNMASVIVAKEKIFQQSLIILIRDSLEQAARRVSVEEFWEDKWKVRKRYLDMYKQSEDAVLAVKSYIKSPLYDYVRIRTCGNADAKAIFNKFRIDELSCRYDFYSDYWLLQRMCEAMERHTLATKCLCQK